MAKLKLKVENRSLPFLFLLAVFAPLAAALAQFNIIDLTPFQASLTTLFGGLFVAMEVGVMGMIRKRKLGKDATRIFGALVASVAIIGAFFSLIGFGIAALEPFQGILNIFVIVYVVIEAFR